MNRDIIYDSDTIFERVSKSKARKAYNNGYIVRIAPVNGSMHHGTFRTWVDIKNDYWSCEGVTFDSLINNFEYYNCNNELGRYTKYYIEKDSI